MSDIRTYKANFKTNNKYLKYFCNTPASEWSLQNYENHFHEKDPKGVKKAFIKNLIIVKNNAKGIPSDVNNHIDQLLKADSVSKSKSDPCTSSSQNIKNITVCKLSSMKLYA